MTVAFADLEADNSASVCATFWVRFGEETLPLQQATVTKNPALAA